MKRTELPVRVQVIAALLDESAGEMTPAVVDKLREIDLGNRYTTDAILDLVVEAEESEVAYREEAARCTAFARQYARRAEGIRAYLQGVMEAHSKTSLDGPRHSCELHSNSAPLIEWQGDGPIPEAFRRTKIELDKAKAKVAFNRGELPLGFTYVLGSHLKIT